jgi:hypothetical protein
MTAGPEVLPAPGKERVSADIPGDVSARLRVWAALRRLPAAHIIGELICQGVPTADQLAAQMKQNGAASDAHH